MFTDSINSNGKGVTSNKSIQYKELRKMLHLLHLYILL